MLFMGPSFSIIDIVFWKGSRGVMGCIPAGSLKNMLLSVTYQSVMNYQIIGRQRKLENLILKHSLFFTFLKRYSTLNVQIFIRFLNKY